MECRKFHHKWRARWRTTSSIQQKSDAMIMSSFREFMVGSPQHNGVAKEYGWGIMSSVKEIPKRFTYETIIYYSDQGIQQTVLSWGDAMRKVYNKGTALRDADITNSHLSYWTDNGAYYVNYYVKDWLIQNETYQEALVNVLKYAKKINIPYRTFQYSVWYNTTGIHGGEYGGTVSWKANRNMLPEGIEYLHNKLRLQSTAHNRWWSKKTPYAKQNGGKYNFLLDDKHALPLDQQFWIDMFAYSKMWGMKNYMQDWLNEMIEKTNIAIEDVYTAKTWLNQMGEGALMNGITVQYCMSLCRQVLQSLEIPAVTQVRASNDFQPGNENWRIGYSSLLSHALGLAPFKDTFWTTSVQPGNFYHGIEPSPALHVVIATLSTGPVGPGDKVGYTNRTLLMKCCRSDGLILKPSRPALAIDAQFKQSAFGGVSGPSGEVWTTYTDIGKFRFGIILATVMSNSFAVGPMEAGFGSSYLPSRIYGYNDPASPFLAKFTNSSPVFVTSGCTRVKFCLFYTTPVLSFRGQELLLLGERDKWVPMSPQRVTGIVQSGNDVQVHLKGAVAEEVHFSYIANQQTWTITCTMPQAGTAWISLMDKACYSAD